MQQKQQYFIDIQLLNSEKIEKNKILREGFVLIKQDVIGIRRQKMNLLRNKHNYRTN